MNVFIKKINNSKLIKSVALVGTATDLLVIKTALNQFSSNEDNCYPDRDFARVILKNIEEGLKEADGEEE